METGQRYKEGFASMVQCSSASFDKHPVAQWDSSFASVTSNNFLNLFILS